MCRAAVVVPADGDDDARGHYGLARGVVRVRTRPREDRRVDGGQHAALDSGLGAHGAVPVVVVHACAVPGRSACVRIRRRLNADAVASMGDVPVEYVEAEDRHGRLRQALSVHSVGRRCRQTRRSSPHGMTEWWMIGPTKSGHG